MKRINEKSSDVSVASTGICDRLYDVLLAKAYRGPYAHVAGEAEVRDAYSVALEVDVNDRGRVTAMRIAG